MVATEPEIVVGPAVEQLRSGYESGLTRDLDWREAQLDAVIRFLEEHTDTLTAALRTDLGRSEMEAWSADIGATISEAEYVKKHFRKWAQPRRRSVPLLAQPGRAHVVPEPLGLTLVIAPWNYPVNLVLEPLIAAVAAGNAVVVKPSEISEATSSLLARELPNYLDDRAFAIFEGGKEVSSALLDEKFDHIFFTGSTRVGRIVMEAAAENLTPVTLELGGKSPAIVCADADIDAAADRIAWGKGFNAGQTCIAPDYVLVDRSRQHELVDGIAQAWRDFYGPDASTSKDYGRIVSRHHHDRLTGLIADQTIAVGGETDAGSLYISPTVVVDPDPESPIMTEEIFGPILPILAVDDVQEAIRFVNDRPKPLALYAFSGSDDTADSIVERTSSGGVVVNHTLFHFAVPDLPFGGVGASGTGRYHGQAGFDATSNLKGVLRKPIHPKLGFIYPPYGSLKSKLLKRLS